MLKGFQMCYMNGLLIFGIWLAVAGTPGPSGHAQQLPTTSPSRIDAEPSGRSEPGLAMDTGLALFRKGRTDEALVHFEQALNGYRHEQNFADQITVLRYIGESYHLLGTIKLSATAFETALALAEKRGDEPARAAILGGLGSAYMFTRDAHLAQPYLEQSLASARQSNDQRLIATALNSLGNLYTARGEQRQGVAAYHDAYENAVAAHAPVLSAKIAANLGSILADTDNQSAAERWCDQATDILKDLADSRETAYLYMVTGHGYRRLAAQDPTSTGSAARSYSVAVDVAERIGDKTALTYALGYLGRLYEQNQRYEDAATLTRRALFVAQEIANTDATYRWQWQNARLLAAAGRMADALKAYRRAIATVSTIRHDLAIGHGNLNSGSSFRESIGPLYVELADLLLRRAEATKEPDRNHADLLAARDVLEQLKSAELADYFQDDCVNIARSRAAPADLLTDKTAIVYLIPLPDRTELLVTLPSGLKRYRAPVASAVLLEHVKRFRAELVTRTTHKYIATGQRLFEWLIGPLTDDLTHDAVDTLVFVPDGGFRTIPMGALYDGEHFLIERFAVAVIPGMTLVDPKPLKRDASNFLISGISASVQDFPELAFVDAELSSLQSISGGQVLQNSAFNLSNFQQTYRDNMFSVVHIASHGKFDRDARNTFILAYDDKLTLDMLENLLRPDAYRGSGVDLLTLSACQTAAGDERAALGLAGTAIKAGARSVLASLWLVNDEASTLLMTDFYSVLRDSPTISKAKALQHSQQALLSVKAFRHPCYWAPYLLLGNWL